MEALNTFSLLLHDEQRESWGLDSTLLLDGHATGKAIPGYVLEAQYRCGVCYLFVTSWDSGEDSLEIVLTDPVFRIVDRKTVGAMYDATWLESHEAISENQLLLRCDNNFLIRITIENGLVLHQKHGAMKDFIPYPTV